MSTRLGGAWKFGVVRADIGPDLSGLVASKPSLDSYDLPRRASEGAANMGSGKSDSWHRPTRGNGTCAIFVVQRWGQMNSRMNRNCCKDNRYRNIAVDIWSGELGSGWNVSFTVQTRPI
ncbi:hypothetical protein EV363DRAFT_1295053 [Boletus edulis]|nr:hypothetical protein EV363DRAFT_1295053 [Boletus edulis]